MKSSIIPKNMIGLLRKTRKESKAEALSLKIVELGDHMNLIILGLWSKIDFRRKKYRNIKG